MVTGQFDAKLQPYEPSTGSGRELGTNAKSWKVRCNTAAAVIAASIATVLTSCLVMKQLVGLSNLKVHYWLMDNAVQSLDLDIVLMFPHLNPKFGDHAKWYAPCVGDLTLPYHTLPISTLCSR